MDGEESDRDGEEGSRRKTKMIPLRWQNIINNVSEKSNRRDGEEKSRKEKKEREIREAERSGTGKMGRKT